VEAAEEPQQPAPELDLRAQLRWTRQALLQESLRELCWDLHWDLCLDLYWELRAEKKDSQEHLRAGSHSGWGQAAVLSSCIRSRSELPRGPGSPQKPGVYRAWIASIFEGFDQQNSTGIE
jgi:hypothetical protein